MFEPDPPFPVVVHIRNHRHRANVTTGGLSVVHLPAAAGHEATADFNRRVSIAIIRPFIGLDAVLPLVYDGLIHGFLLGGDCQRGGRIACLVGIGCLRAGIDVILGVGFQAVEGLAFRPSYTFQRCVGFHAGKLQVRAAVADRDGVVSLAAPCGCRGLLRAGTLDDRIVRHTLDAAGVIRGGDLDHDILVHVVLRAGRVGRFSRAVNERLIAVLHTVPLVGQLGSITGQARGVRRQWHIDLDVAADGDAAGQFRRWRVGRIRQLQVLCIIVVQRILVVHIHDVCTANGGGVFFVWSVLSNAAEEQLIGRTDGAIVAVGHIHKVVRAADGYDIPHVATCTRAACHRAGHQRAGNARILESVSIGCQVAEVLERLGVALADDIGVILAVEHVNELPRIAVATGIAR